MNNYLQANTPENKDEAWKRKKKNSFNYATKGSHSTWIKQMSISLHGNQLNPPLTNYNGNVWLIIFFLQTSKLTNLKHMFVSL